MIVEKRTYTLKVGQVLLYLSMYEARGYSVQTRHLGLPVGYYYSETGLLNQIIHMWRYQDAEDRQRRRMALYADPEWQDVVKDFFSLIEKMETQLLNPAPFFTLPVLAPRFAG